MNQNPKVTIYRQNKTTKEVKAYEGDPNLVSDYMRDFSCSPLRAKNDLFDLMTHLNVYFVENDRAVWFINKDFAIQ